MVVVASSTDAAWLGLGYIGGVQVATAPADAQSSPTIRVGVPSRPDTVGHTQPAPRQRPGAAARPSPMHLRYPWLTFTELAADYEPMCGLHTNSTSHADAVYGGACAGARRIMRGCASSRVHAHTDSSLGGGRSLRFRLLLGG